MSGTIPSLPQYAFMAWCLVKAQGQLYLLHLQALPQMVVLPAHALDTPPTPACGRAGTFCQKWSSSFCASRSVTMWCPVGRSWSDRMKYRNANHGVSPRIRKARRFPSSVTSVSNMYNAELHKTIIFHRNSLRMPNIAFCEVSDLLQKDYDL
jgi:hypothetical protein